MATLAGSYIFIYFQNKGFALYSLLLLYLFQALLTILLIPLFGKISLRKSIVWAYIFFAVLNLSLAVVPSKISFYVYPMLNALASTLFWIPLNYLFFRSSQNETNARDSSIYSVGLCVLGIIAPPLGALIIHQLGYGWLFGLTAGLYLIPIYLARKYIAEEVQESQFISSFYVFKGLKTITFCEGSIQYFTTVILPVYTLLFFTKEFEYGFFLSYVAVIGSFAAIVISYLSDKVQKRMVFVYPLFLFLTLSILGVIYAHSATLWIVIVGIITVLMVVSYPLRIAVSLDVKETNIGFWRIREFFLNVGRFITLLLSLVFFYLKIYWPVFVIFSGICLFYPFLIRYKFHEVK